MPLRDESRLLVYERRSQRVHERRFAELPDVIGDALVVVNDTKVVPARIPIEQPKGEVLLLERLDDDGLWEGLARPTRRLRPGRRYGPVELLEHLGEGRWRLRLHGEPAGETPLPPYITEPLADPTRYQTVYARDAGSAAAPTAGLHFTEEVLARLDVERVTLHVGLDTFRPVSVEDLDEHQLHGERYEVEPAAWERIRAAPRVLAVGTTTVRVLETLARGGAAVRAHRSLHHPGFRLHAHGCAAHELPPAPVDAARARDGFRGSGGDAAALPDGGRAALSLLFVRRCNAGAVNVRRAHQEDAEIVAALYDEATEWVGDLGYSQWPSPFPRDQLAAAIDRGEVYVVETEDGEPVATVAILLDDPMYWGNQPPDAFYVHKLAVRRDQAGRGIGAAVVEWANAEAAEAGREFLRLDCLGDNPGIRDYYEDLGFEHRGDLVLDGRNMSLYERPVR